MTNGLFNSTDSSSLGTVPVVIQVEEQITDTKREGNPEENITVVSQNKKHDSISYTDVEKEESEHH